MNKVLKFLAFAVVGALLYALFAYFNLDFNPARGTDPEHVEFSWRELPIWAVLGGVVGLLPVRTKDRDRD